MVSAGPALRIARTLFLRLLLQPPLRLRPPAEKAERADIPDLARKSAGGEMAGEIGDRGLAVGAGHGGRDARGGGPCSSAASSAKRRRGEGSSTRTAPAGTCAPGSASTATAPRATASCMCRRPSSECPAMAAKRKPGSTSPAVRGQSGNLRRGGGGFHRLSEKRVQSHVQGSEEASASRGFRR